MAKKKAFEDHYEVEIMNNVKGMFIFTNDKTNSVFKLNNYGDVDKMEFHDLEKLSRNSRQALDEAWIIILDDDVAKYFKVDEIYKNIVKADDLDKFFEMDDVKMKGILANSPKTVKENIAKRAQELYKSNSRLLADRFKVRVLQEELGIKFED